MDLESALPEYMKWFERTDLPDDSGKLALRGAAERGRTLSDVAARIEAAAGEEATFVGINPAAGQLRLPFEVGLSRSRPLFRPNEPMRLIQRLIVSWFKFLDWEMGGPHDSVAHNLYRLRGSRLRYIYRVDLVGAYGAVPLNRLAPMLVWRQLVGDFCPPLGRDVGEIRDFLRRYCGHPDGGLVQGGAASPYLFDRYVSETLDVAFWWTDGRSWPVGHEELSGRPSWAYANQLRYLRLADDLVFASRYPIGKHKRGHIVRVLREAGFEPSPIKTKFFDLARGDVVLNGAGLQWTSSGIKTFMPAERRRRLEGLLYRALERGDVPESVVHGHMGWFYQLVDRNRMSGSEQRVDRLYRRYKGRKKSEARLAECSRQTGPITTFDQASAAPINFGWGSRWEDESNDQWGGWADQPF